MPLAQDDQPAGIPEWVVTFGDMMSLLLTFFIMLVSLSEMKQEEKFQAMMESLRRQFGHELSTNSLLPGSMRPRNSNMAALANMGRAKRLDVMQGGDKTKAPTGDHPQVRIIRPGTLTTIGTVLHFDELAVELTTQQQQDLMTLGDAIAGKPQKIEVRGHATGRALPPDLPYADAWQLSYARAKAVADFLEHQLEIEPLRIRIAAAGASEPYTLEANVEAQRLNPRVEVFLLEEVARDLVGMPGEFDQSQTTSVRSPTAGG
jgi:chemotaxis protein MotB